MVAEALTLVGLNFPQSKEGARSQNPGARRIWVGHVARQKNAWIDPLVLGFSAGLTQVLLAPGS
jgi:hypothetical protein